MYIEDLIYITVDHLYDEEQARKYNLKIRKERGLFPDSTIWIPSLNGSDGYRLGELTGRCEESGRALANICKLVGINQDRLISAVKAMQRWERRQCRWHIPDCLIGGLGLDTMERLATYLKDDKDEWYRYYKSTGRKKAWCE